MGGEEGDGRVLEGAIALFNPSVPTVIISCVINPHPFAALGGLLSSLWGGSTPPPPHLDTWRLSLHPCLQNVAQLERGENGNRGECHTSAAF